MPDYPVHQFSFVAIEDFPYTVTPRFPEGEIEYDWHPEVLAFPQPVRDALEALTEIDAGECAACRKSVGYTLVESEDTYGRETAHDVWRWTGIVWVGPDVRLVCEDCSPNFLIDLLAEED